MKDMKYRDENGKEGRYSGDVDEDHSPHGQGKMKYKDGSVFVGVWSEGSQVHGKTSKSLSSSKSSSSRSGGEKSKKSSSSSDWARKDGKKGQTSGENNNKSSAIVPKSNGKKVVRKMKWMDYYGDPGEYSGEVDSSNMPNGKGSMKYDHGLVQEGLWTKGQFVEGSDMNGDATVAASGSGGGDKKKKPSSSRSGGGGSSSRKHSSSSRGGTGSSGKRLEP